METNKDHPGEQKKVFGDPEYDADQDIYSKEKRKSFDEKEVSGRQDKTDPSAASTEEDLDVPGAELDDSSEILGEEDEENNYYSLGGEQHNDLDEDQGE